MAIASLTPAPAGGETKVPFSQIAIELYRPLPGGIAVGGHFAPAGMQVPGLRDVPAGVRALAPLGLVALALQQRLDRLGALSCDLVVRLFLAERFAETAFNVEMVSRLRKPAEVRESLERFSDGRVDVLINNAGSLVGRASLRPGETILIHGAGGGVSGAAIEIARLIGARIFATTSGEGKAARVRDAGAAGYPTTISPSPTNAHTCWPLVSLIPRS